MHFSGWAKFHAGRSTGLVLAMTLAVGAAGQTSSAPNSNTSKRTAKKASTHKTESKTQLHKVRTRQQRRRSWQLREDLRAPQSRQRQARRQAPPHRLQTHREEHPPDQGLHRLRAASSDGAAARRHALSSRLRRRPQLRREPSRRSRRSRISRRRPRLHARSPPSRSSRHVPARRSQRRRARRLRSLSRRPSLAPGRSRSRGVSAPRPLRRALPRQHLRRHRADPARQHLPANRRHGQRARILTPLEDTPIAAHVDFRYALARAYQLSGKPTEAAAIFRRIYLQQPLSGEAAQARAQLQALGVPLTAAERKTHADELFDAKRYSEASDEYHDIARDGAGLSSADRDTLQVYAAVCDLKLKHLSRQRHREASRKHRRQRRPQALHARRDLPQRGRSHRPRRHHRPDDPALSHQPLARGSALLRRQHVPAQARSAADHLSTTPSW